MADGMITSWPCPRPKTRSRMLHAQDRHAKEPHCCHCSPPADGETDRRELKLVPFVTPSAAAKGHGRRQKVRELTVVLDPQAI